MNIVNFVCPKCDHHLFALSQLTSGGDEPLEEVVVVCDYCHQRFSLSELKPLVSGPLEPGL